MIEKNFKCAAWDEGHRRGVVDIRLQWEPGDPLVVSADVTHDQDPAGATWTLSREVLTETAGSGRAGGLFNIKMRRAGHYALMVTLDSPGEGVLTVSMPLRSVKDFLKDVEKEVRVRGGEQALIDHQIAVGLATIENEEQP